MNFKALSLGALIGFLVALSPSCGGVTKCDASNCGGCCDKVTGVCVTVPTAIACGASGVECKTCNAGETCSAGVCKADTAGKDGGVGTDGGTACNASNCAGCCAAGKCQAGTQNTLCGKGGALCETCDTNVGETCSNQVCTVPDGGPIAAGSLGSACTQDSDCDVNGGNPSRCKLTTSAGNLEYKGGYCTRRCLQDTDCGSDGMCIYGLGPFGEAENICVLKCDTGECPRTDGYACLNFGSQSSPMGACWIDDTNGNNYATIDAGPPAGAGVAGSACADDSVCQPPASGFCITADQGYPGGSCSADCSLALVDEFCGTGGACSLYAIEAVPGQDPFVVGLCERACNPDGGGTPCRAGYACEGRGAPTSGRGSCVPRCDVDGGVTCPAGSTCTNGLCQ